MSFYDMNLWVVVTTTILLVSSEFIIPYYGAPGLVMSRGRLRRVAIILSFLSLFALTLRTFQVFWREKF